MAWHWSVSSVCLRRQGDKGYHRSIFREERMIKDKEYPFSMQKEIDVKAVIRI